MTRRDRAAFVGRASELDAIAELFVDDPPASVVLVHGPGGIGKSALLRQVADRAREAGWSPVLVEGRELPPVPDALDEALAEAHERERPLILIDTYERMTALGGHLRRALLPSLPEHAIVVVAGRQPPERGWFEGGLETITREIELGPLSLAESQELLGAHGLSGTRRDELARWAGGSPLALTLSIAAVQDGGWSPDAGESGEMVRTLVRRLAEAEIEGRYRDVLGVACIARVTTLELLRDVLPDTDPTEAMRWLESRSFAEALGGGLTLHDLVRRALRADLLQRESEREHELRRRIADSLYARAVRGQPMLTVDLAELVQTPQIRAFYGWEGSVRNRVDGARRGDAEQVALLLGSQGYAEWWDLTRPFFEEAPETVAIARDAGDALCGFAISVTPANAPPAAERDVLLGPWLRYAREHSPNGNAILWRDAVDFTRDTDSQIQAMINMAGVLRSGLDNPRHAYLPVDPELEELKGFLRAIQARHLAELDIEGYGHKRVECWLVDYGPGGLLGAQRDTIYLELGLAPPGAAEPPASVAPADAEVVRDALRNLRLPHALAQSPLARGESVEERAAGVRALLEDAARRAFGDTDSERLMQRVLERGYLDPAASHEQAADELNLSRAAYFRRLKLASERLAEVLGS
jgi:AAA ATPase domain